MTRQELERIIARNGMKIDGQRQGAGKFVDLEIGVGCDFPALRQCRAELVGSGLGCQMDLTFVDNSEHPEHGKPFLMIHSFWND